ncbi:hypothetical protein COLSTE_00488 [Collinsella stercoris DSM 13279]|uniref:Uncharacterized protein n=1 Tax=Collinsella stercoris DSM 13279 TaxID=445975 RepID=B6G8U7_9ACTN|nr:hypothetical protein COLSTE_00488 [Collinsella stercoris DSM 13279]
MISEDAARADRPPSPRSLIVLNSLKGKRRPSAPSFLNRSPSLTRWPARPSAILSRWAP